MPTSLQINNDSTEKVPLKSATKNSSTFFRSTDSTTIEGAYAAAATNAIYIIYCKYNIDITFDNNAFDISFISGGASISRIAAVTTPTVG